jgi:hypothetical protein
LQPRRNVLGWALAAIACAATAIAACSTSGATAASDDASAPSDAAAPTYDLCDAFSGVGTACALPGPFVCFALCDGGCTCGGTADAARWACVTDLSCVPGCSPLDALDGACAADAAYASADDAASPDAGATGSDAGAD